MAKETGAFAPVISTAVKVPQEVARVPEVQAVLGAVPATYKVLPIAAATVTAGTGTGVPAVLEVKSKGTTAAPLLAPPHSAPHSRIKAIAGFADDPTPAG